MLFSLSLVNPIQSVSNLRFVRTTRTLFPLVGRSIYNLCFLVPLAIFENSAWGMPAMNLSKPPKASATCNLSQ